MTGQGQFQTSPHAHAADGSHDRFGAVFDLADYAAQIGIGQRLGGAEFADIGAAGEPRARPDQHDRFDAEIGIGAPKRSDQGLTQFMPKTIDRGIFESQNGDCAADLEAQLVHACVGSAM